MLSACLPVRAPRRRSVAGLSMIEVLIALAVFSLALIGQIRLQMFALGSTKDGEIRTIAAMEAADIADRMRANREGFNLGSYFVSTGTDRNCGATHYDHAHAVVATCTAAQLADDDLADWIARINARLPAGDGVVCRDSTPDDGTSSTSPACDGLGTTTVIKVWWQGKPQMSVSGQEIAALPSRLSVGFNP